MATEPLAVIREPPSDDIAFFLTAPGGARTRWAADEPGAENVITGIQLIDAMPGGDKESSGRLARNPRVPWPDLGAFTDIRAHLPGGFDVGNYRLEKALQTDGDEASISPAAVGYSSMLDDDQAVMSFGFISSLLSRWTGPSTTRRHDLNESNFPNQTDPSVVWDPNIGAALRLEVQGTWAVPITPVCEAWFDGGSGVRIAAVYGNWVNGNANTAFQLFIRFTDDDRALALEGSGDAYTAVEGPISWGPVTPRRYCFFDWLYNATPAGGDGYQFSVDLINLKAVGQHPLALRGTFPKVGYTASQILGYAVPQATGLTADPDDLEDTGYLIEDAWYSEPLAMSAIVADVTKYDLLDWWVGRGEGAKRFQLKRPGMYGRRWQAYAGPSGLEQAGLDASRLWRSIVVAYQGADGNTRTVGPIGSGATVESTSLEITDPDHPAVRAGVPRNDLLTLSNPATAARAEEAGVIWLREANVLSRSGSAKLTGYVLDDGGVLWPASCVRAGDQIRFPDAADTSYRKITGRNYDHDSRTATIDLDAPPEGTQALLERMSADIQQLQL